MNTDRLPAIMLRNGDRIANRMVIVDPNAILSLDRHIGLFIAAAPKQIVAYEQIFAFDLRRQGQGCIPDLLVLVRRLRRSDEHTSELQSLMPISYAVLCLTKKK